MMRAILIGAGTLVGVSAALAYTPGSFSATTAQVAVEEPVVSPSATTSSKPSDTSNPSAVGTFTGPVAETRYGPVQVAITVAGGKIVDASAVAAPSADAKSADISQQAIPQLREATLTAQSAEVAAVSGATFTSTGWRTSLQAALAQAGL